MATYPVPDGEAERLATLRAYDIVDTPPEAAFDTITRVVARLLEVPYALVTLVENEHQWFKSVCGLDGTRGTPRSEAFCAHTIMSADVLVVPDARRDERFAHYQLVREWPYVRFYAGAPLVAPDGHRLGSLCALDTRARVGLADDMVDLLQRLADLVVERLELHALRRTAGRHA